MATLTSAFIAAAVNGRWIDPPPASLDAPLRGVGTDSRSDLAGTCFIALRGPRHDGHDHLGAAGRAGAVMAIVDVDAAAAPAASGPGWGDPPPRLRVSDTREALRALGRAWRRMLDAPVVGITGSVGKTTTKELVAAVLRRTGSVTAAPSSWNNDIGVPLTLLRADPADAAVVVEIGTGGPGEIAALGEIAWPDVAIITAIGRAHLGAFSGPEGIVHEKAQLASSTPAGGVAIVTADSPPLRRVLEGRRGLITVGHASDAHVRVLNARETDGACGGVEIEVQRSIDDPALPDGPVHDAAPVRFAAPLVGLHHAGNIACTVALASVFGVDDATVREGLQATRLPSMRMERVDVAGVHVHDDAWNASPESMGAALHAFHATTESAVRDGRRRVAILGDMLELGAAADELHAEIGDVLAALDRSSCFAHLVLVGTHAARYAGPAFGDRVTLLSAVDGAGAVAARSTLAAIVRPGDHVLLKASRGIGLERCRDWFRPAVEHD